MKSTDVADMNQRLHEHATDAVATAQQMREDADRMRDAVRAKADALEAWARATLLIADESWTSRPEATHLHLPQAVDLPAFLGRMERDLADAERERAAA